jgi:1,4-dihydroxy-2-naphthoyl-CoA hydrolase
MDIKIPQTLAEWNAAGAEYLPGHLGLTFLKVEPQGWSPN